MSILDALLLGATLLAAGGWILAAQRTRRVVLVSLVGAALLAAAQFVLEGYYWQLLPGYLLILATAGLATAPAASMVRWRRLLAQVGLIALIAAAIAPWALFLPVPKLPRPTGPHPVGTVTYRWVDPVRDEAATSDPSDRRNVVVQAWYPAAVRQPGRHSIYIDGMGRLPGRVSLLPSFLMRHFDRIDTHAAPDAPVAVERQAWPVVLFLNGYGGARAVYSSLAADLASRGYVVLAIDNPYEAAVTELADGRIATTVERFLPDDPDRIRFMQDRLRLRIGDVRFVLDQLERPEALGPRLSGRLDTHHLAAIGHSLGGATAELAMNLDDRIKAAANIDGTLYGGLPGPSRPRPFLLLESDHAESGHSPVYETVAQLFFNGFGGGHRYEIKHANHYSFTDVLQYLAPPGRFAASLAIGGSRGPAETERATADILTAFLQGPLTGAPASVERAAARYRDIVGGPVKAPTP